MVLKGLNFLWQGGARVDATRRLLSPDLRLRLKQRQEVSYSSIDIYVWMLINYCWECALY